LKDEKLAEDLTTMGNAFHRLAAFRKNELKSMFFLAKGIWIFNCFEACMVINLYTFFEMRGCRVGDAIPNIIL